MKKVIIVLIGFLITAKSSAQVTSEVLHPDVSGKIYSKAGREHLKIEGSQYFQKNYQPSKVVKINNTAPMRYNVYRDEFEFISPNNDTLVLDKIDDFGELVMTNTNTKYKLVNYFLDNGQINNGYLIDLYQNGDYGLFKKENITLTDEKIAKTSMETSMPAKYNKAGDTYFLKYGNKIVAFPESKKRLTKLFQDKKEALEQFVKKNKVDLDTNADKIKTIDFLATK